MGAIGQLLVAVGVLSSAPAAAEPGPPGPPAPVGTAPAAEARPSGPPTLRLSDAVALALEGNFPLRGQADAVASARYFEEAARARFHPRLTPSLRTGAGTRAWAIEASQELPWTGGRVSADAVFRQGSEDDVSTSDLRVTLSQPLLRGFGETVARFDVRNSERAREAQERSYEVARQRVAVDVAQAFYQVARQRRVLEVSESSLERSLELMRASEERMAVGLASRLDVLRAELQAEQARDAAVSAEAALQQALEQFRTLLGLAPGARVEPEPVRLEESVALALPALEVLVSAAYANRLELAESRDRIGDARRALHVAGRNLLPQLDVNVSFVRTGVGDRLPALPGEVDQRVDFFVSTSYPVERAADRALRATARLELARSRRELRQRELEIEAEVRAAVRDLERIHKSIAVQRKRVVVADEQHRLATLRYERGLASNFDVVDAEASLVAARTALAGLVADFHVARFRLRRTTGELDVSRDLS